MTKRYVREGQNVKQFDKIAEVQSDKASVEITSRFDGKIARLHYKPNETALVGRPLLDMDVEGESIADDVQEEIDPQAGPAVDLGSETRRQEDTHQGNDRIKAIPSTRYYAKQKGIDIERVKGTGKDGLISISDIDEYVERRQNMQGPAECFTVQRLTAYQRAMARTMEESLSIPHFGYTDQYNVTLLSEKRKRMGLTLLPFIAKAVSKALQNCPILNSHFDGKNLRLKTFRDHDVCIAVDSPHGLAVPVIRQVQNKNVADISKEISQLQKLASANKLSSTELQGGTITLSNIGSIGGLFANPVILSPQVCIGALAKARLIPTYDHKMAVIPQLMLTISWSADHRVIDGATMARFSNNVKELVEDPERLLE